MLKELSAWNRGNGYPFRFYTEASINLADDEELLEAMSQASFASVFIGIETPDPKLLKTTLKMQNIPGDPLEKLRKIREHGIHIMGGFILGFDGEERGVFEMQRSFIHSSGIGIASTGLLQAVPHTQLSRRLKKEGRLLGKTRPIMNMTLEGINFIPKGEMTKREYLERYRLLIKELYAPKGFFERFLPALLALRNKAPLRAHYEFWRGRLPAAVRTCYHLGVKAKGARSYFWRVFLRVLWKNPASEHFRIGYRAPHARRSRQRGAVKSMTIMWSTVRFLNCSFLLLPFALFLLPFSLPAPAADARKIMEGVYRQDNSRDTTWRAVMDVVDKKGIVRQKKFSFWRLGSFGDSKTLVRFTDPTEVRGVGLLSINRAGVSERQWLYTPSIQRTRRIAPQERSRRFLGTDFSNEDMAERVLDDFAYRMLNENASIDGRAAYQIEARPVARDRSQYRFVHIWVPRDVPYVVHAEMYDEDERKVRVLHATGLERISGIWVARRIEMSSPADHTKTVLGIDDIRFNVGLKEDLFTQQALEKGGP